MHKRPDAVVFKGKKLPLVGPELKVGDTAPDFACLTSGLEVIGLGQTPATVRLFSVVPSLDTPVCSVQTKRFEEFLGSMHGKMTCYTVSLDLPFAQKRFCTSENLTHMHTLSDVHNQSFGKNYGVLIEGLPLALLSRAIFVVDKNNKLTHVEYVLNVPDHPNYDQAMAAVRAAVG